MVNMSDRLLVDIRVHRSRREIVKESEIRIDNETQLYGQRMEGCLMKPRCSGSSYESEKENC